MNEDRYIQVEADVYIDTTGGPSPQWRAFIDRVIVYGLGALMLGGLIVIFLPTDWGMSRQNARRASCQSNLKQISLGIMQYTQDYDECYPLIAVNNTSALQPYGWANAVYLYAGSSQLYHCPSAATSSPGSSAKPDYTDYWFNRKLAHEPMKAVIHPESTFMLGDGLAGGNARASLSSLPAAWKTDQTSPLWRHLDGANYAFTDGHVKWLSATKPAVHDYHFALK